MSSNPQVIQFAQGAQQQDDEEFKGNKNMLDVISSDQEKSLVQAVEATWPKSTLIFCTRHLEDNLNRFLNGKGLSDKVKKAVRDAFFAEKTGLIYSEEKDFAENKSKLINNISEVYFKYKYLPEFCDRIENNVCAPRWAFNWRLGKKRGI